MNQEQGNCVLRSCSICEHFKAEEIGDSDFGAVYADEQTCALYKDTDTKTEETIKDFDRTIQMDCCEPNFWAVLEIDSELKESFDNEAKRNNTKFAATHELFKKKYPANTHSS